MARRSLALLEDGDDHSAKGDPLSRLRSSLGELADVRPPGDAEEPILTAQVRRALGDWLAEIRAEKELSEVGVSYRTTALFYGPPGTGKTTLAHHLAARLGIPLVVVGSENIIEPWHGSSEKNIAKLFRGLSSAGSPSVVLLDEIEFLGGDRKKNTSGGADNARSAQLGVFLRKVEEYRGFLIGATNRPGDLDPALWRRFHMQISVDLPGEDERFAILKRYGLPFAFTDDDLEILTALTDGASPALLRGLMEGIKRSLVVRPKVGRAIDDPKLVIAGVVAACAPPPEIDPPELWAVQGMHASLDGLSWPPAKGEA